MKSREVALLRRAAAALRAHGDPHAAEELERAGRDLQRDQLPDQVRKIVEDVETTRARTS